MLLQPMTLAELDPGQVATVAALADADSALARRLANLGLVPGTSVKVERRAPLGDPTIYLFRGTRVALRSDAARSVVVAPSSPGSDRIVGVESE